jgi:hypothetical protein
LYPRTWGPGNEDRGIEQFSNEIDIHLLSMSFNSFNNITWKTHMSFLKHDIVIMLVVLLQKKQNNSQIRDAIFENFKHAEISTNNIEE